MAQYMEYGDRSSRYLEYSLRIPYSAHDQYFAPHVEVDINASWEIVQKVLGGVR